MEKKLNETVNQMRDLADELRKNAEKTENKQNSKESLQKNQQELQKKYEEMKKDLEDLKKMNKELEDPTEFKDNQELQKDADQNMQQSQQNLEKNNRSKSADNQKKAADDIDKMAEQMEQDFNESQLENITEDIATIRQILDNLVKISFDQEEVMKRAQKMSSYSASVSDVMRKQFEIKQTMKHIEDSLSSLARRQAAVKPFIQKEVTKIQSNIETTQSELQNRRMSNAAKNQQFALTSMNNLALMLMESMSDMQEQQQQSQSKCNKAGNKSSCNKPGGKGKPKKASARELQQQLNRQMEAMKKSMEQQAKQGQTGKPQQNMSEQFAKMAAQQEAIRKMLQDYQSEQKQLNGVGDKNLDKIIEDMQKTEKDLVNRQITQQTINRQKDITTRLLQSERADMEREKDKERKSNEARQVPNINPPKDWNFDRQQIQQNEMLRSVPPSLNYYYKSKANNYFYNID
jgi:DNA repair exonuclease SbcCD ATPase subunit